MKRTIYHFSVGNGCCSLIEAEKDFVMVVDLNHSDDFESSYEMLKPFFRLTDDGKECIDVLCVTHGDLDHCKGFREFKNRIESGELVVGTIWHQGYDRRKYEKTSDLEDDYIALMEEIDRRRKIYNKTFGDFEEGLNAGSQPLKPSCIKFPVDFAVTVLNPTEKDVDSNEFDINNLSCVLNVNLAMLNWMLYTGDTESSIWQKRIIPYYLEKNPNQGKAKYLISAHHGSYTFFGADRDKVINANPYPDNYVSLNLIKPEVLITSAVSRFPISGDKSGDNPPHYAAWKWYHKWFVDNRGIKSENKHPECFLYTSDGHIKLDLESNTWKVYKNIDIKSERIEKETAKKLTNLHRNSNIMMGGLTAKSARAYREIK